MSDKPQTSLYKKALRARFLSRTGPLHRFAITIAVVGALFNIIGLNLYPVDAFILRPTFLFVCSVIGFIVYPAGKTDEEHIGIYDIALLCLSLLLFFYLFYFCYFCFLIKN